MIPYERQEKILEALAQDELLKIEQLQSILPTVSISTLRRDLKELEKSGRVELLAGGAVKICSTASEMQLRLLCIPKRKKRSLLWLLSWFTMVM